MYRRLLIFGSAVFAGVLIWGLPDVELDATASLAGPHDTALWSAFVQHLASGRPYYETAIVDYHAYSYPTFTVANIRQPTLYMSMAWLGVPFMLLLRGALAGLLVVRVWQRFRNWVWVVAVANASLCVAVPPSIYFAETWAGFVIALSILAAIRGNVPMAVAWAFVGLTLRELVAPYCLVMVGLAVWRGRRRELWMWLSGIGLYIPMYAVHAYLAMAAMPVGEPISYSYIYFGGIPFLIRAVMFNGVFALLPWWGAVPVLTALVIAGTARGLPTELRWTGIVYAALFLVVGQPFNYYWGAMIAPVFACWLPFVWEGLRQPPLPAKLGRQAGVS